MPESETDLLKLSVWCLPDSAETLAPTAVFIRQRLAHHGRYADAVLFQSSSGLVCSRR